MSRRRRLLLVLNADWYFFLHWAHLARAAVESGLEVAVAAPPGRDSARFVREPFRYLPVRLERGGMRPEREAATLADLVGAFRAFSPDLVHLVTAKPVLYGSLAARLTGVRCVVCTLPGLGRVHTARGGGWSVVRAGVETGFRLAFADAGRTRVIVQNPSDQAHLLARRLVRPSQLRLIIGTGVDLERFAPSPEPDGPFSVLTNARLLWDKGIAEVVEAGRLLRERGRPCRVVLAGAPDPHNPEAVPVERLTAWCEAGLAEYLGWRDDVPELMAGVHVVCLPSYYGEGAPVCLMEAAASGRPAVTADTPGCRDVVRDGETGLVVPPRDAGAVAEALARLEADPALRRRLGARARRHAEETLSAEALVAQHLAVYRELL